MARDRGKDLGDPVFGFLKASLNASILPPLFIQNFLLKFPLKIQMDVLSHTASQDIGSNQPYGCPGRPIRNERKR